MKYRLLGLLFCLVCLSTQVYGASSFDRELVVKDQDRAIKVENVLKQLLRAYENEDARQFLDYVSEDRFRQDYLTFTDALYNDFRTYEIHRIDYWVDRVVADNVKQFFYARWEKRYESLDDGRQYTEKGYSRFVFDEVNGEYLLIELAGNDLFGSSLPEWTDETSSIPGQEISSGSDSGTSGPAQADLVMSCASFIPGVSVVDQRHHFYIKNQGTVASGPSVLRMDNASNPDILMNVPNILPGQTVHIVNSIAGYRYTNYELDYTSVVSESNESNNDGKIVDGGVCP